MTVDMSEQDKSRSLSIDEFRALLHFQQQGLVTTEAEEQEFLRRYRRGIRGLKMDRETRPRPINNTSEINRSDAYTWSPDDDTLEMDIIAQEDSSHDE